MTKKWIVIAWIICTAGLIGCQGKSANPKIPESQQLEEPVIYEPAPQTNPVVEVVDPTTNTIIDTISPQAFGYDTDMQAYQQQIAQLAQDLARGTATTVGYDQHMVLDKLDEQGKIIKGRPHTILKERELVESILAVSATGGQVEMPLTITKSSYSLDDIPYLEDVVVATYTTYFNRAEVGRNKNIELSAKAIHNIIVGSGDYFSFNHIVGPRDEANGYQPAPEIINKQIVMGIGGGICQTSSTLFNAVDQIPVKLIERHHHSLNIGYVPRGRDATVAYGSLDFRFQNISDAPFLIKSIYGDDFLTIEIRTAEKYVALVTKQQ
ncbi:VanW family protein [Lysinibacillus sp. FSL K6-0232]|uniref:VanW family protein n=1 Tax=unclassified Lysinibacillus TaxID=2636778 RepID=UPI0030FA72D1